MSHLFETRIKPNTAWHLREIFRWSVHALILGCGSSKLGGVDVGNLAHIRLRVTATEAIHGVAREERVVLLGECCELHSVRRCV